MRQEPQNRGFDAILRDVSSVDEIEQQLAEAEQIKAGAESHPQIPLAKAGSLGESLAPILYVEKTDLMFWMLVIQTCLLFLIWRSR